MLETASAATVQLNVLAGGRPPGPPLWSAALSRFFDVARDLLRRLTAETAAGRLGARAFLSGKAGDVGVSDRVLADILASYPLALRSPFEDTQSIAGGLWSGRTLFGPDCDDGLAKLKFMSGTLELPLHVHEYSDRFIVAVEGSGRFWWSDEDWESFVGRDIHSIEVRPGDVLIFTRGLLHTFSAPQHDLLLLSYHSPEIPFDDPRQYTLPRIRWTPALAHGM